MVPNKFGIRNVFYQVLRVALHNRTCANDTAISFIGFIEMDVTRKWINVTKSNPAKRKLRKPIAYYIFINGDMKCRSLNTLKK